MGLIEAWLQPPKFARGKPLPEPTQGYGPGRHTIVWRELSWAFGDEHADRICRLIDLYLRIYNVRGRSRLR